MFYSIQRTHDVKSEQVFFPAADSQCSLPRSFGGGGCGSGGGWIVPTVVKRYLPASRASKFILTPNKIKKESRTGKCKSNKTQSTSQVRQVERNRFRQNHFKAETRHLWRRWWNSTLPLDFLDRDRPTVSATHPERHKKSNLHTFTTTPTPLPITPPVRYCVKKQ